MTDLPVIKDEWWLEVHRRAKTGANDADVTSIATLEDVRAVLDAAGYAVVEKVKRVEQSGVEYRTARTKNVGDSCDACGRTLDSSGFSRDGRIICYECEQDHKKTSGASDDAVSTVEKEARNSRPAEGREEPGICEPCSGTGSWAGQPATLMGCPYCNGTGKTSGHANDAARAVTAEPSRPAEGREEPGTDESWASAEAVLRKAGLDPDQVLRNASEAVDKARAVSIKAYRAAALGALDERDEEPGTCERCGGFGGFKPVYICSACGGTGALHTGEDGEINSRPAEGREEPGTIAPLERTWQEISENPTFRDELVNIEGICENNNIDNFEVRRRVLEKATKALAASPVSSEGSTVGAAKLHEQVVRDLTSRKGPVNDKICVTCHEIVEARLREEQARVRDLEAKLRELNANHAEFQITTLKMISDAKEIASAAIESLVLANHPYAVDTLRKRLNAL